MKTYEIILKNKDTVLKKKFTKSLLEAESIYYQFCCFSSVRSGYNSAELKKINGINL